MPWEGRRHSLTLPRVGVSAGDLQGIQPCHSQTPHPLHFQPHTRRHTPTSLGGHGRPGARISGPQVGGSYSRLQTFPTFLTKVRCLPRIGSLECHSWPPSTRKGGREGRAGSFLAGPLGALHTARGGEVSSNYFCTEDENHCVCLTMEMGCLMKPCHWVLCLFVGIWASAFSLKDTLTPAPCLQPVCCSHLRFRASC